MQLQIECNYVPFQKQICSLCDEQFEMTEAKILVCNDRGQYYGEVCPQCLEKGFDWLSDRFQKLERLKIKADLPQALTLTK
ncbi:MAG: hypothetical protein KME17_11080 [Cyanosarcina radialis HA8281-LM2]|jgi:predicted amidophosphoribosyltransferase|nr:hypothetical protein [Cyanosarcina radialis HA8281-LM2]